MADINMTPTNMQPQNEEMLLKYMMQQGTNNAADQSIAKKQALLNQLRQTTDLPGMIQGGGARTIQAAHPLSAIANVAGQVMGAQQQRGLNDQTQNVMGDRRAQLADLVEQQRQAKQMSLPMQQRQGYVPPQAAAVPGAPLPVDPTQTYGAP
jgi:hypothetical protein